MTALSDLLRQANVQGWSSREIARRAEKSGHKLSYASAAVYFGGRHGVPSEDVLAAFSDVLNIPIDKLRRAAGVPAGAGTPWSPPVEANRLDVRQRRALEELIRSMVASEPTGEDQDDGRDDHQDGERSAPAAGGSGVAGDAERDGVTPDEPVRPWEKPDFDLAAKQGLNRGRAARGQQDRDAEAGGA